MMSLLSIFVILGIAADDIFVFVDAWNQSAEIPALRNEFSKRFSYVYRRASKAMFVTTLTTFCAFLATSISDIAPISAFGLFSANLVMSNYFLVITYFPICLIFKEKYFPTLMAKLGFNANSPDNKKTQPSQDIEVTPTTTTLTTQPTTNKPALKETTLTNTKTQPHETVINTRTTATIETKSQHNPTDMIGRVETERQLMGDPDSQSETASEKSNEVAKMSRMERFFAGRMTDFLIRTRWFFVVLFVLWVPVGLYLATEIPPLSELERWFPKDHDIEIAIDQHFTGFHQGEEDGKIPVEIVFGVKGVDRSQLATEDRYNPEELGELQWDPEFDLTPEDNQQRLDDICTEMEASALVKDSFVQCWISDMKDWLKGRNEEFPVRQEQFVSKIREFVSTTPKGEDHMVKRRIGLFGNDLRFAILRAISNGDFGAYSETYPLWQNWEKWMKDSNRRSPIGLNKGFQSSYNWQLMITERALVRNAFEGMAIAGVVSLIVLLVSTGNFIVAFFAIFSIVGIVSSVLGLVFVLKWEFGMVVSIAVVILIGFSVDYTVHISHAYVESVKETRQDKTRETLQKMGVSISGGAITTFGTGAVLFLTTVVFFFKFAWVITSTIFFSIAWSLLFLPSILLILGPEGDTGNLRALAKRVTKKTKQFMKAKKHSSDHSRTS
eukprot:CAMPEP_0115036516 /NCGR_PEP_ID=MMETSP0216-20121206/42175_1 /TAXON_ID=223996 /ORGANISM="Protocruzia adherens, Strain Boccale" /LENGTH=667 /DNA_ID=CAMNT_0002416371 /DNA_START=1243 /DNA_END=3246 /DNA_ORIENTATION=+